MFGATALVGRSCRPGGWCRRMVVRHRRVTVESLAPGPDWGEIVGKSGALDRKAENLIDVLGAGQHHQQTIDAEGDTGAVAETVLEGGE